MNKLLKNPNFNNIGEFWAIRETVEETANCLGITEEEVREVFDYHDNACMDYFIAPEDEEYYEIMNK